MQLTRIETPGIAHYAYLIADGTEAAVVDPRRDIAEYLVVARRAGVRIRYVLETHRQEDFVMGSASLASRTNAQVVTGDHEIFGHGDIRLSDGDGIALGSLRIRALHTPGHTPESMCYAVFTKDNDDQPCCLFTGDTLLFGTTGRTDLPDDAKSVENAALLYDSVHKKLGSFADSVLLLPAHGPGSVCGSGVAPRAFSTLGQEKRDSEVFLLERDVFAEKKGGERPSRPPHFRHMEKVNRDGGMEPSQRQGSVPLLEPRAFAREAAGGLIIDTREPEAFAGGHIEDSVSIWLSGLPVFAGWTGDEQRPVFLVTDREEDIDQAVMHLSRIGIDQVLGGLASGFGSWRSSGLPIQRSGTTTPGEVVEEPAGYQLLDVREVDEYGQGHIPAARHCFVGSLFNNVDEVDLRKDQPVVVTCSVGHRAGLAVSILQRHGFADVRNLLGGMNAWRELDFEIEP